MINKYNSNKIFSVLMFFLLFLNSFFIASNVKAINNEKFDFIVITTDEFFESFESFTEHKSQHDLSTKIITLENIYNGDYFEIAGRDDAEKIKYFIKNSIENWETKYVMLVGTNDIIPARSSTIYISFLPFTNFIQNIFMIQKFKSNQLDADTWEYFTDLYYADIYDDKGDFCDWDTNNNNIFGEKNDRRIIDEIDLHPDISIGRLLCSSVEEVEIVISKIIDYEVNASSSTWFEKMIVCGGDTHSLWRDIMFMILPQISSIGPLNNEIAFEGEYMGDKAASFLPDFDVSKIYSTGSFRSDAISISIDNINSEIEKGAGFLLLSGHGYPEAWGTHPPFFGFIWLPKPDRYHISNVKMLTNKNKLPIAIFSACSMGDFKKTDKPIAWEFVGHENGGSIASFACTTLGTLLPTTLCSESLNGYLSLNTIKLYSKGNSVLGDVWRGTIDSYLNDDFALDLANIAQTSWLNHFNVEQWILFGDPTLKIGGYSSDNE